MLPSRWTRGASIGAGPTGSIARALARKVRTPPPPRRPVQAPQRRVDPRDPDASRKALYLLAAFALLGVVVLGGVVLFLTMRDDTASGDAAETMRAAGCTYQTAASEGRDHVRDGANVRYKTSPPTSGNHYAVPVTWGAYDEPVEQERVVHNLEHGGIVIQYGDVGEDTIKDIQAFYLDDPNGLVVAPYSKLGKKIALTAWNAPRYPQDSDLQDIDAGNGYVMTCTQWDEAAASEFRDERRNKAGERFPSVADMAPGT